METDLWTELEHHRKSLGEALGLGSDAIWEDIVSRTRLVVSAVGLCSPNIELTNEDIRALGIPEHTQLVIDFEDETTAHVWVEFEDDVLSRVVTLSSGASNEVKVARVGAVLEKMLGKVTGSAWVNREACERIARKALVNEILARPAI